MLSLYLYPWRSSVSPFSMYAVSDTCGARDELDTLKHLTAGRKPYLGLADRGHWARFRDPVVGHRTPRRIQRTRLEYKDATKRGPKMSFARIVAIAVLRLVRRGCFFLLRSACKNRRLMHLSPRIAAIIMFDGL